MMSEKEVRALIDDALCARRTNAFLYACAVEREDKVEAEHRYRLFFAYGRVADSLGGVVG